ncbi:MBL fold metallo-hydrolase [Arthrobacter oryzae]|uniref:MBL fold metallo-hydrolase n=1 Tax=Arthrobacter oryzae TaxID=409290 RepID=UPI00273B6674|nr:MBL fold metallo-hydrolase [Arthrobacter oryzae]WLQ08103.1 MBL fold metallo-hydrolase [Arthrobacter oryzae]
MPTLRSVTVGEFTVTYLPDGYVQLEPDAWFSLLPGHRTYSGREKMIGDDGFLTGSIGSLLITGAGKSLLIDAGFGSRQLPAEQSHPALGAMHGGQLGSHGVLPDRLDAVAFTHLHEDHTGWLNSVTGPGALLAATPKFAGVSELSAHPGKTGPQWTAISDGTQIIPGVTALATPGHTRGHMSYLIESQTEQLLCFGDVMHSPVQVWQPELNSCFEADPQESLISRERVLNFLSESGAIGAGMHFGDVVFGRVGAGPDGERHWEPVS